MGIFWLFELKGCGHWTFIWSNSFTLYNSCCIQYEHHPAFPFILSSSSWLASVDTIWKWRRLKRLHCGPWQGLSSDSMQIKSVLCAFSCWGNAPIQSHGAGGQPSFWFLIRDRGLWGVRAGGSGGLSELEICLSGWNRLEVTSSGTVGFGSGMRAKLTWCVVNHSRCKAQGDCFANDDSRMEVAALFSKTL